MDLEASLKSRTPLGDVTSNSSLWYGGTEARVNGNETRGTDLGAVEDELGHEFEDGGGDRWVVVPQSQRSLQQLHVGGVAGVRGQGTLVPTEPMASAQSTGECLTYSVSEDNREGEEGIHPVEEEHVGVPGVEGEGNSSQVPAETNQRHPQLLLADHGPHLLLAEHLPDVLRRSCRREGDSVREREGGR